MGWCWGPARSPVPRNLEDRHRRYSLRGLAHSAHVSASGLGSGRSGARFERSLRPLASFCAQHDVHQLLHQAVDGLGGVVRLVLERGTVRRSGLCPTVPTSSGTRRHVRRRDVRVRLRRLVLDAWSRRTASRNAAEGAHGRAAAGSFSSGILSRTATAGRSAGGATPRRTRPVSPTVHPSLRPRFSIQPLTTDSSQPTRLGLI